MSVPLLNDSFWTEEATSTLHGLTVLQRIRHELSDGRESPITVAEVFRIATEELGFQPSLCIFAEGEIARPLFVVGAVWGVLAHGMKIDRARSFGMFLGRHAGGDAIIGRSGEPLEAKATEMLRERLGGRLSLGPSETGAVLDDVIGFYQQV